MRRELDGGWIEFIPDFLSKDQAEQLFEHFLAETPWNQGSITIFGKRILIPRKEAFYSKNGESYHYSGQLLKSHSLTSDLDNLVSQVQFYVNHDFNAILLNLYRDGNDSNGWHADNEKELGQNPVIASLSLGSTRRFDLRHNTSGEKIQMELTPGSLLIMGGALQHTWKHQIAKSKKIKNPRINLTFRKIIQGH